MNRRASLWISGLFLFAAAQAVAGGFYLVWGQARSQGFSFYGKQETVLAECNQWMLQRGIRRISRLSIRAKDHTLKEDPNVAYACREILRNAISVGDSEVQSEVSVEINYRYLTYAGSHLKILQDCERDMAQYRIPALSRYTSLRLTSVTPLKIKRDDHAFDGQLRGPEICGSIASIAQRTVGPFVARYLAGSIYGKSFLFYGYKEQFVRSCINYVRLNQITQTDQVFISDRRMSLSAMSHGDMTCEVLFNIALAEINPVLRYEVEGSINNRQFYFVGTRSAVLDACKKWVSSFGISATTSIVINAESKAYERPILREAICFDIASQAFSMQDNTTIRYAIGAVRNVGFAIADHKEELNDKCLTFLNNNNIGLTRDYRLLGKTIFMDRAYGGRELCGKVIRRTAAIDETMEAWTFRVAGRIGSSGFSFRGSLRQFVGQCSDYFAANPSIKRVDSYFISEEATGLETKRVISPPTFGAETCHHLVSAAAIDEFGKFAFVSGQVARYGFSIAGNQAVLQLTCKILLDQAGIKTARLVRVFDREYTFEDPLTTSTKICQALLERETEYDEFPAVPDPIVGSMNGKKFTFVGKLDDVNNQCVRFVMDNGITDVEKVKIADKEIACPLRSWAGMEVCGAIIRHVLKL
jgi:hypothetical protein